MRLRSLRVRLVVGVALWTLIVLGVATAVAIAVISHNQRAAFAVHNGLLFLAGAVLSVAGIAIVRSGLSPFTMLRERLAAVREGRTTRLEGEYPTEVSPLVDDLNALLAERDLRVARAVARAGDLAHGLKTPLAVLAQDVQRAEIAGQSDLADSIRRQVERMRRQIHSHLASARAAAGAAGREGTSVAEATQGLVRTMERIFAEKAPSIAVDVPPHCFARVPLEDLEEMLGNLLDNACKWAAGKVAVSSSTGRERVLILVDDDGPGLAAPLREQVLQRGVRLDETAPGTGLGLAIVQDLAEAYGGTIRLKESPLGGLRAELVVPAGTRELGGTGAREAAR